MSNAREIRCRIRSVATTAKVTRAMQLVASSKMKRAQEAALAGRPFARLYNRVVSSVAASLDGMMVHPLLEHRDDRRPCAVVISTDKGLCGSLNTQLLREATMWSAEGCFVSVGKKGRQFLARTGRDLVADFDLPDRPSWSDTQPLSQFLISGFLDRRFDSVSLIYSRFVNTLSSRPVTIRLIPLSEISSLPNDGGPGEDSCLNVDGAMEFEPSPETVLELILPYYVSFLVHQAVLSARASEHSARMVAMKHATDNAGQLVKDLTLDYNQARQTAITNELLEISAARFDGR